MANRNFMDLLRAKWEQGKFVCVGLDSDYGKLPPVCKFNNPLISIVAFNKAVIDATADLVCAYKPNLAFYIMHGSDGIQALSMTMDWIKKLAPDVPVILDAKFADIGNTNIGYAKFTFDYLGADAITLQPYLGKSALQPFLERKDKGCIILCRTSNPGAGEFQDMVSEQALYRRVAHKVARYWNGNQNCCLVAGATYPEELANIRASTGDLPLLIPGIGKQGGDLEATIQNGIDSKGQGIIINSSRGIIFASNGENFAAHARIETQKLHDDINGILAKLKT